MSGSCVIQAESGACKRELGGEEGAQAPEAVLRPDRRDSGTDRCGRERGWGRVPQMPSAVTAHADIPEADWLAPQGVKRR